MPNEPTKQKLYETLRGQIGARLIRTAGMTEGDLEHLSLGEIINTLFLMHGDSGSTGNFNVTFGAALKMVGRELMWQEPEVKPAAIATEQRVN